MTSLKQNHEHQPFEYNQFALVLLPMINLIIIKKIKVDSVLLVLKLGDRANNERALHHRMLNCLIPRDILHKTFSSLSTTLLSIYYFFHVRYPLADLI